MKDSDLMSSNKKFKNKNNNLNKENEENSRYRFKDLHEISENISEKFKSKKALKSKHRHISPKSAEREYCRLINKVIKALKRNTQRKIPGIKAVYKKCFNSKTNVEFLQYLSNIRGVLENESLEYLASPILYKDIDKLAKLTMKFTAKDWAKACKKTLGVDIREDYYMGSFYKNNIDDWVKNNVDLIKSIPNEYIKDVYDLIYKGYTSGKTLSDVSKSIEHLNVVSANKAKFIARDQISKLNADIQKAQQIASGIEYYIWLTSKDERVRQSHRELDGKNCRWDNPPENSDGRACHPGEDYGCRCIAIPVFEKGKLSLPVNGIEKLNV